MKAPFDLSKLRKSVTKSIPGMSGGFNDPKTFLDTGCYALNYLMANRFDGGVPLEGKSTQFAGDSGCLPSFATVKIRYRSLEKLDDDARLYDLFTVENLKTLFSANEWEIEVATPDGYQKITEWFDKGVLNTVVVTTKNGLKTTCAVNHLLEVKADDTSYTWVPAENVAVGSSVLTEYGDDVVVSVVANDPLECFDFTIDHDNHRYFGDGFSSHNSGKSYIVSLFTSNNHKGKHESTI